MRSGSRSPASTRIKMTDKPMQVRKPEEEELSRKLAGLSELEFILADRELFLTGLRSELVAFEQTYLRILGARYAELDEIEAKIAECVARARPDDPRARNAADRARSQASASRSAADL